MQKDWMGGKGTRYMQLSFLKWSEYKDFYMLFKDYADNLKKEGVNTEYIDNVIKHISVNRKSNEDFRAIVNLRPTIFYDAFMALYVELIIRDLNNDYKAAYEDAKIKIDQMDEIMQNMNTEVQQTFKEQEYEIKRLRSELKKYKGEDDDSTN